MTRKEYYQQYQCKNKDRIREVKRKYRESNLERIKSYKKEWYLKNRERVLTHQKNKRNQLILQQLCEPLKNLTSV